MKFNNTLLEPLLNRGRILSNAEILEIISEYERKFKNKEPQSQQAVGYSLSLQMGTNENNRSKLQGIKPIWSDKKGKDFLKYLSRQNYLRRIFSGLYYVNSVDERIREFCEFEDKEIVFMALNKLKVKWYLGLGSSLYLQGKKWQTPNQISVVNTKFSGTKKVFGLKIRFFKTKENMIFGLKKTQTKHNIEYFYSDPAKTHIDRVYFKETDSLVKVKNTQKYLKRYPKWVGKK